MRKTQDLFTILIVSAVLASAAAVAAAQAPPPGGTTVGGHMKKPHAQSAGHAMMDSSMWSATTYEAASSDEHRKVLAGGKRETVIGEVVDISCYLQLGKRGAAHIACGTKCATNGQPIGLLSKAGTLYFLFPEEHHPRRDGQAEIRTALIPQMGKTVTLKGTATMVHGSHGLFLKSADISGMHVAETGTPN